MASTVIGEEFAIDRKDAHEIAEPLAAVAAMYPNSVISPKVLAWTALGGAIASVHGPRFAARMLRVKMEREERMLAKANAPKAVRPPMPPAPMASAPRPAAPQAEQDVLLDPGFVSFTPERQH